MRGLAFALALCAAACGKSEKADVDVELRRDGSQMRRLVLTGKTDEKPPSDVLLEAPSAVYSAERTADGNTVRFEGDFSKTPPDLRSGDDANHGATSTVESRYGTVFTYRESLPGRNDTFERVLELGRNTDEWVDTVRRVAAAEFEGEPGLERLLVRLDGPIRRDAKELLMLTWSPEDDLSYLAIFFSDEGWYRAIDFLETRGYLRPELSRGRLPRDFGGRWLEDWLVGEIARSMGRADDEELLTKLRAFAHSDRLESAFKAAAPEKPATEEEPATPIATAAVSIRLSFEGRRPAVTNGEWSAEERAVTWSGSLNREESRRPLLYAIWTEPNEAWQRTHLGGVELDGEQMLDLIREENAHDEKTRRDWNALVEALRPDDAASIAALRQFEPGRTGAKIVLDALERARSSK